MIINEKITVSVTKSNKDHYFKLGYNINNKLIEIDNKDLTKGSHTMIKVKCDKCGKILKKIR
jgi:hypothetical protein